MGTGGTLGAPEAGADQTPSDTNEDRALDSTISAGVTVSPPSADFSDVVQGASSTTSTIFTVTNAGPAIALKPTVTGPFAMVSNTCDFLAAGGECTIGLSFNPVILGKSSGVLIVAGDATASLTGTGVAPAQLAFQPPATVTVSIMVGRSSPTSFTLVNSGGSAAGAVTLTPGGDVDQFTIDNQCIAPLAPLSFCRIIVVCKPTSAGSKTLTLTVTDANSPTTSLVATVNGDQGSVGSPVIYGTGDFGTVTIGATSSALEFTLSNPSATDNAPPTIAVTDTQFVVTSDNCSNLPLAAGKSCTFSMVFKPSAMGPCGANVTVSTPGTETATLPLKGVGATTTGDGGAYVDGGAPTTDGKAVTDGGTGGSQLDSGAPG